MLIFCQYSQQTVNILWYLKGVRLRVQWRNARKTNIAKKIPFEMYGNKMKKKKYTATNTNTAKKEDRRKKDFHFSQRIGEYLLSHKTFIAHNEIQFASLFAVCIGFGSRGRFASMFAGWCLCLFSKHARKCAECERWLPWQMFRYSTTNKQTKKSER